ncbi:hypothetical protein PFLUV_G00260480 [Perca fluviatilis]|uniref:MANSC domain-containing protein n=1 Tax=Perca fluviatilis TaxID=8168 RepID=A0A6A5DU75_PERFL|nr:hypothetical protein PFLUV_G00260480 [Perca fluviatilis]
MFAVCSEHRCGSLLSAVDSEAAPITYRRSAVTMTPPAPSRTLRPPGATTLVTLTLLLLMTSLPMSAAVEPETCFSRQHQSAIVNVRQALTKPTTAMDARVVRSERDCVLACCSEEVKPGAKCNMAVFNGNKHAGEDNCFLFHCQTEQDCPLMKAQDAINTYDIYKATTTKPPTSTPFLPITDWSTVTPAATLLIVPKGAEQSELPLQNLSAGRGVGEGATATRGALKTGMVVFMVLGLAVLTLALAAAGRKAMESFDRRHYTRLELNDLHYEV